MSREGYQSEKWLFGSRFERWAQERTMCTPDLCVYEYACSTATERERYVRQVDCFRFRPPQERPQPALCRLAVNLLHSYHSEK